MKMIPIHNQPWKYTSYQQHVCKYPIREVYPRRDTKKIDA